MMICFAGFLQNSCCNNTNKNKITTTKNTECKCGHLTQLRAFTDVKCRVSVLYRETQTTTNFFISGTRTSKIIYFCGFLALPPLFSWKLMGTSLLGAPSQDLLSPMPFFDVFFYYFLDAFLKKRMALPFWKSDVNRWLQTGMEIFY